MHENFTCTLASCTDVINSGYFRILLEEVMRTSNQELTQVQCVFPVLAFLYYQSPEDLRILILTVLKGGIINE